MMRFIVALLAALVGTTAHAQSGTLQANQVWAGPTSGGQGFARGRALVAADLPALSFGSFALASGQILVGQVSGFAGAVAMSGDCTIVASGAITCTKTSGVAFGTLATVAPGTGVATALAAPVGSAGSVVLNGGALGTPASGVGTNLTALKAANVVGTATNDNAAAGNIGEYISSNIPNASAVPLTSTVAANVTSISLTAGDWQVCGQVWTKPGGTTTIAFVQAAVTPTSATMPTDTSTSISLGQVWMPGTAGGGGSTTGGGINIPTGCARASLSGTTTYFLVAAVSFGTSTMGAYGTIQARRQR